MRFAERHGHIPADEAHSHLAAGKWFAEIIARHHRGFNLARPTLDRVGKAAQLDAEARPAVVTHREDVRHDAIHPPGKHAQRIRSDHRFFFETEPPRRSAEVICL